MARYNSDGSLDTSEFGMMGKVSTDFPLSEEGITGLVVQPDGRIVATGAVQFSGTRRFTAGSKLSACTLQHRRDA